MAEHAAGLATEKEARDVAEAARESEWSGPSFVRELFLGRFRLDLIHPHPVSDDPAERARAAPFLAKLRDFLERVDSDMIDRTGEIPESYVQELREMGAFGIKIPEEYGGLGLSYASYTRAMAMVTSKDGSLTALLSASQSIGLPQPLKLFGTAEQKRRFFPRLAKGAISAFALTEMDAGSDPANLRTSATPSEDGKFWTLNGEKLWCTNGTRADLLVVMARTPDAVVNGKSRKQITAFIVEAKSPGVEIVHRSRFMGLKAIENGVLHFTNVRVPAENILWGEPGIPVERAMRDFRINLIFEGTSEVMRLFIAREAVDHHFKTAFALVDKESSTQEKMSALGRVMKFYPGWYLARWFGRGSVPTAYGEFGALGRHLRWAERRTRHLGRMLFHAMARFGPKLERRQMVLFRAVDIGADLFAMTAACVRARMLAQQGNTEAMELADLFCREARQRITTNFHRFYGKNDATIYRVSQRVLDGKHAWLEAGIVGIMEEVPVASDRVATRADAPGVPQMV